MSGVGTGHDVRAVADAVLYEGYLLYPYRATSGKNQSRWQFGVLGPPGAAEAGVGEESGMSVQCVLDSDAGAVAVTLRFLHLQARTLERPGPHGDLVPVDRLTSGDREWISWDEASECEIELGSWTLTELMSGIELPFEVPAGVEIEPVLESDGRQLGRIVRTRRALSGHVEIQAAQDTHSVLSIGVRNTTAQNTTVVEGVDKRSAPAYSMLGAHLILECDTASFISLFSVDDSQTLIQNRCYPVLAGVENPELPGRSSTVLASPIILYDFPEIAEQSEGALFDATEIDEILTLRILTMTDDEKVEARATDPKAAAIIDRCEGLTPESLADLHGVLRDPHVGQSDSSNFIPEVPDGVDWWTPEADTSVSPHTDAVMIGGVCVAGGSTVRLHPSRRADAQDLFFDGRIAHVATIHEDVDGDIHVGVTLIDDPAADLHNWYGRYLYFAPDEVEPVSAVEEQGYREENGS